MDIIFLDLNMVLRIHQRQIEKYGGEPGTRDEHLLLSALSMPQSSFGGGYLHSSISEMAAAYLFHIAMNHPFIDGNKRTATATAAAFVKCNGYAMTASPQELADFVWRLSAGELTKADAAEFFKQYLIVNQA